MNPIKMRICNECNRCSFHRPQPLAWGHECWGYTEDGHRIIECESHIEDIPMIDSFTIDGEQTSTPATGKE